LVGYIEIPTGELLAIAISAQCPMFMARGYADAENRKSGIDGASRAVGWNINLQTVH
jgi:hypothetical protein